MKYAVKINSIRTVEELEGSWNNADLTALLSKFDYTEADKLKPDELKEYLSMAITDFEPEESAAIVLEYRLSDVLTEGQIHNISHEMTREKVSENYSDIAIHKILFDVNQLLYKAYNGKFPLAKANVIDFEMKAENEEEPEVTKALILQAFENGFTDRNLIKRLFKDQLEGIAPFPESEGILWELKIKGNGQYMITTSEKWINNEDFKNMEFESDVSPFIDKSEGE